jgi:hypothetical protein
MNNRTIKILGVVLLVGLTFPAYSSAADEPGDLSEGVFVEDDAAIDKIMDDEASAEEKPDGELNKSEEQVTKKKTEKPIEEEIAAEEEPADLPKEQAEEITKEIVEESDEPPPAEFPYPGATEEGYGPATQLTSQDGPIRIIQPIKKLSTGEYFYGFKSSPTDAAASVRFGFFTPPDITNPVNNKVWEDIYTDSNIPTLFVDYEWLATRRFGALGIKVASGLFMGTGTGQFVNNSGDRANREAFEKYTFIMFPNLASLIYRFQYYDTQPIVPYIEGGGGYFTFAEIRDDGSSPKFGGAPVGMAAGGVAFLMDWLDQQSIRELDNDWGVNHVWLTAEYRLIQGLHDKYDFTSGIINAGIKMEF